jgi:uncharacterized protein YdaU (DUF1376 family)
VADYPALPLWTDAYLADTGHLSDAEHGLYLRFLMLMWRSPGCRVPDDPQWLARKLGRPLLVIESDLMPLVSEFCKKRKNFITQKRLLREYEGCKSRSKTQAEKARARWKKEKQDAPALPEHGTRQGSGNASLPFPSHTLSKNNSPNGELEKKRAVDVLTWEPNQEALEVIDASGLDRTQTIQSIRDWAANAAPAKRRKRDPVAFIRQWCAKERPRGKSPSGGVVDAGLAVLRRANLDG